jgi:hypothetical protein
MTYAPILGRSLRVQSSTNGAEDLNNILNAVKRFSNCSDTVVKNLAIYSRNNKITLECKVLDVGEAYWDGELIIRIVEDISAREIINFIVIGSYADEIHMIDDKTLRLWWD